MSNPSVCCICLTADRQQLTDRAVRSFLAQDYEPLALLIYDTGKVPYDYSRYASYPNIMPVRQDLRGEFVPIGKLRNMALWVVSHLPPTDNESGDAEDADIICHWDSDDWSAPSRISEQVNLLVQSGKQAVGYNEMLFWQSRCKAVIGDTGFGLPCAKAWLYHNSDPRYIIDTSSCFWRSVWEAKKFPECHIGEGREWIKDLDTLSVSSLAWWLNETPSELPHEQRPMMIAEIHGANTTTQRMNPQDVNTDGIPYWRRVPEWDERVRKILEGV